MLRLVPCPRSVFFRKLSSLGLTKLSSKQQEKVTLTSLSAKVKKKENTEDGNEEFILVANVLRHRWNDAPTEVDR